MWLGSLAVARCPKLSFSWRSTLTSRRNLRSSSFSSVDLEDNRRRLVTAGCCKPGPVLCKECEAPRRPNFFARSPRRS